MQIQSGKLYENRTWNYLYPSLKGYGKELMDYLGSFFKLAVGIGDFSLDSKDYTNCIFILIDTNMYFEIESQRLEYKRRFAKFLDWVSYQPYYVTDYVYGNIGNSQAHMVVVRVPMSYEFAFLHFIRGEYSKMYDNKDIRKLYAPIELANKEIEKIRNDKIREIKYILKKDRRYLEIFVEKVRKDWDEPTIKSSSFIGAELDYPPKLEEEVFNFIEEGS